MDTITFLIKLKTYPKTYTIMCKYFNTHYKNNNFIDMLKDKPITIVLPYIINYIEEQNIDFLDALYYTKFYNKVKFNILQIRAVIYIFSKIENNEEIPITPF